jgi:pimeloyl-ACP methyl ester carboxylesterase
LWTVLIALGGLMGLAMLAVWGFYFYLRFKFLDNVVRIFQEKPLFIVPRGQPIPGAEEVRFATTGGLTLHGCYLRTPTAERRGVVLFGLEFGSNCWACWPYCETLVANGFDVFTFEPRNQGQSDAQPGYDPLQWVTNYEVDDFRAALTYLKARPDADPRGIGFFGISKGGGAGLLAAARDPWVRCFATDGIFAAFTTMVPYMRKWIAIYSQRYWLHAAVPMWFYGLYANAAMRRTRRERHCRFPHLEGAMPRLRPRPLLMIHGGGDTYIKPEMARALFDRAQDPKEFWLVDNAKHNQALQLAGDEYRRRILDFFLRHMPVAVVPAPRAESALQGPNVPACRGSAAAG